MLLVYGICCGYSLEVPRQSTSNVYPQHMFSWRNKKNINNFWLKNSSLLELCNIHVSVKDSISVVRTTDRLYMTFIVFTGPTQPTVSLICCLFNPFYTEQTFPHYTCILEESIFNFRYSWLRNLQIPKEKMAKLLQTVETLIRPAFYGI